MWLMTVWRMWSKWSKFFLVNVYSGSFNMAHHTTNISWEEANRSKWMIFQGPPYNSLKFNVLCRIKTCNLYSRRGGHYIIPGWGGPICKNIHTSLCGNWAYFWKANKGYEERKLNWFVWRIMIPITKGCKPMHIFKKMRILMTIVVEQIESKFWSPLYNKYWWHQEKSRELFRLDCCGLAGVSLF